MTERVLITGADGFVGRCLASFPGGGRALEVMGWISSRREAAAPGTAAQYWGVRFAILRTR